MEVVSFLSLFQLHSNYCLSFLTLSDSMNIFSLLEMMINFLLTFYVINDFNEIKILLKEGSLPFLHCIYSQVKNKASQFSGQMASKVTHETNKKRKKLFNICNKPNYLKETCISFYVSLLEKIMKFTSLLINICKQWKES